MVIISGTKKVARTVLGLLYPAYCRVCGAGIPGGMTFFCEDCLCDVELLKGPHCVVCGRHFPSGSGGAHVCWSCIKKPPAFEMARAPVHFGGAVREAIHLFKYGRKRVMMDYLGPIVEGAAEKWFGGSTLVAAVPLHRKRFRHRGFNQSLFLAERAASALGIPMSMDALARIRHTRPQVELDPAERERNVRGAFSVSRPGDVSGQTVLLVDDVYTTGATVNECARVLVKAGASTVRVLTVARV